MEHNLVTTTKPIKRVKVGDKVVLSDGQKIWDVKKSEDTRDGYGLWLECPEDGSGKWCFDFMVSVVEKATPYGAECVDELCQNMYLAPLVRQLRLHDPYSVKLLPGICMSVLQSNGGGVTKENYNQIRLALSDKVCDDYQFETSRIACEAAATDLVGCMQIHEPDMDGWGFFGGYVIPYLTNHPVIPGVFPEAQKQEATLPPWV